MLIEGANHLVNLKDANHILLSICLRMTVVLQHSKYCNDLSFSYINGSIMIYTVSYSVVKLVIQELLILMDSPLRIWLI